MSTQVANRPTGGGQSCGEWVRSRYGMAYDILEADYNLQQPILERAAALAVAHWRLETTCGEDEHNGNVGGIHCSPATPECVRVNAENLRSYAEALDGARDYFRFIRAGYPFPWNSLINGFQEYLFDLLETSYGPGPGAALNAAERDWERILVSSCGYAGVTPWWPVTPGTGHTTSITRGRPATARVPVRRRNRRSGLGLVLLGIGAVFLFRRR